MDKLNLKNNNGFSTIELMIALTIMSLILTAVTLVSFGNQSFLSGSQTNAEAMKIAQGIIEQQQALARKDFNLVNSKSLITPMTPDIYTRSVSVKSLPDFLTKEVTVTVKWINERLLEQKVELTTLVANFDTAIGGNTCDSTLSGDWINPEIESTINFSSISPSGTYTITDLDAYKNKLYVTAGRTSDVTDPTLFIFDISDPNSPSLLGKEDNASSVLSGLNAIRVTEDPTTISQNPATTEYYAYTASNSASDYSTCNPVTTTIDPITLEPVTTYDPACGQLNIINVTDPSSIEVKNLKLTTTSPITGQNTGISIFYKNNYLLLGLNANAGGPELNFIDVHNPDSIDIGNITPIGSFEVGNAVNALILRGTYAYLGTPNSKELQILNLIDPTCPVSTCPAGSFNAPSGAGNGKSMYLVGDNLYLGKTSGAGSDFHILNNINPSNILTEIEGIELGDSVNGVIVRDYLAFILTNDNLSIYDISDPLNPVLKDTSITVDSNATEPSMDCEGNRLYISSNNTTTDQGKIYIIKPGP